MSRLLIFLFSLLLIVANSAPAQPVVPGAPRQEHLKYLILIDASSSMRRTDEMLQKTIHDLLASGAYGNMQRGDLYTIWYFNEAVYKGRYPVQQWLPEIRPAIASNAAMFVKKSVKFEKNCNMDFAIKEVTALAKASPRLTVFLLTDGRGDEKVFYGTPFDVPVTSLFIQHSATLAKERRPFVVTLVSVAGKFEAWSVDSGGARIEVPVVPDPEPPKPLEGPKPAAKTELPKTNTPPRTATNSTPKVVHETTFPKTTESTKPSPPPVVKTNTPAPAATNTSIVVITPKTNAVVPPPVKPPDPQPPPAAVTNVVVAPKVEPKATPSVALTSAPPSAIVVTTNNSVSVPAPVPPPKTNAVSEATRPPIPPVISNSTATAVVEKTIPVPTPVSEPVTPDPTPTNAVVVETKSSPPPSAPPPATQTALVVPPQNFLQRWGALIAGLFLLCVAGVVVSSIQRRSRAQEASFISRALDRERK